VHSSPLKLHQDVSLSLGMIEVPAAAHQDYGESFPARTYHFDARKGRGLALISKFAGQSVHTRDNEEQTAAVTTDERPRLTPREKEIADLVLHGLTNVEIAKRLYLSEITVKKHLGNIYSKLGIKGKTQLVQHMMSNPDGL